ncbi:MAG: cobalamin-binding protein [Bdellovibrionales bacterium]|nr:cobalamin-binding protein [Bdellovibrionales bacterium]
MSSRKYPQRIVCMTEESVELLYLLGQQDRIVGVSCYVERPPQAKSDNVVISSFLKANMKRIRELRPDLILGFSDIQKEIARDLIAEGFNVWIANHRGLEEVLDYCLALGSAVGCRDETLRLIQRYESKLSEVCERAKKLKTFPKVYIEEWNGPYITGIRYFSDLVTACGGHDIFRDRSLGVLAQDRFIEPSEVVERDPDIILGCWCGKKVEKESFKARDGWDRISAIQDDRVFELDPAIFLQPGPALFEEGLDTLMSLFENNFA